MKRWIAVTVIFLALIPRVYGITVGADQPEVYLPLLQDKRVGLVVNQTSRVKEDHLVDYLLSQNIKVSKVFAPEHGFRGTASAGEKIQDSRDEKTGLPITSLYGTNRKPTPQMLQDVDILVFDIQDVGARFYTYISTLHYVMEAAAQTATPVLVLDRPNPNGMYTDGPVRKEGFQSFVGVDPIPVLHGMTVGELAKMIKGEAWIAEAEALDLRVIPVTNYSKTMTYSLPVPPSPNLPNDIAVRLYPTLCFFEATAVSIGRGTALPFQIIGHHQVPLGEMSVTPVSMASATNPKLEGQTLLAKDLRGSSIQGLDLDVIIQVYHAFRANEQTFFTAADFMDKLSGTDKLRKDIEAGMDASAIRASWQADLAAFRRQREPYLLYPLK